MAFGSETCFCRALRVPNLAPLGLLLLLQLLHGIGKALPEPVQAVRTLILSRFHASRPYCVPLSITETGSST